ncbi:MAG: hypothetical protein ACLRYY_11510 [Anaerobutyricum soehngenii]
MGTVTITNPEDASVKIGGSAVFKADLSSTASDYRATNYKWQRREKGGKWQTIDGAKSSKLTLNDLTEEKMMIQNIAVTFPRRVTLKVPVPY